LRIGGVETWDTYVSGQEILSLVGDCAGSDHGGRGTGSGVGSTRSTGGYTVGGGEEETSKTGGSYIGGDLGVNGGVGDGSGGGTGGSRGGVWDGDEVSSRTNCSDRKTDTLLGIISTSNTDSCRNIVSIKTGQGGSGLG
jgi:hypothetical protein